MKNNSATAPFITTGNGLKPPESVYGDRHERGITPEGVTTNLDNA
jgi:hypothetical protein